MCAQHLAFFLAYAEEANNALVSGSDAADWLSRLDANHDNLRAALVHATGAGSDAQAVSYIEAETADGRVLWGVGMDSNIVTASLKAVTCAANRTIGK